MSLCDKFLRQVIHKQFLKSFCNDVKFSSVKSISKHQHLSRLEPQEKLSPQDSQTRFFGEVSTISLLELAGIKYKNSINFRSAKN